MKDTCLVLPTIREECATDFIRQWQEEIDINQIIVVEDNPERTFKLENMGLKHHYCWGDIDRDLLKENSWIISRRDSAIRCYGYWKAHQLGAKYIVTLDDDCHRHPSEKLIESHVSWLQKEVPIRRWTESIPAFRTRGLPYDNLSKSYPIVASMGLWTDVPDLDAIQSFTSPIKDYRPPDCCDRVIPPGMYFPVCGMNLAFRREVVPMTYFPLMGQDSPYGRFDDIWFGVIFKKICDHLGYAMRVGHPYVHHIRESNKYNNLIKEANGIKMNEDFWAYIDDTRLSGDSPKACMKEIAGRLQVNSDDYLKRLGDAIYIWTELF